MNKIGIIFLIFIVIIHFIVLIDYQLKREKSLEKSIEYIIELEKIKEEYENFLNHYYFIEVTLTAYTTCPSETNEDNKNTAIMETPISGYTCAVSRDLIYLLGKTIYIEGIGIRKVTDLMNKRFSKSIDILVPSKEVAYEFGVKKDIKVVLIK